MTEAKFTSPTMLWANEKNPGWQDDKEFIYKMGFARKDGFDVHGYDIHGFNERGVDRLGCTVGDYDDPVILAVAKTCGERMSLSNKLAVPLPRMFSLALPFERLCGSRWDVEPTWAVGMANLPRDGKVRMFTDLGSEFSLGVHWYDLDDKENNFLMVQSDTVARLRSTDESREIPIRVLSRSQSSGYELAEGVSCPSSAAEFVVVIGEWADSFMQPLHPWQIRIIDTTGGAALTALSRAEAETSPGDVFVAEVSARSRKDALVMVMEAAKTQALASMAASGIEQLEREAVQRPLATP